MPSFYQCKWWIIKIIQILLSCFFILFGTELFLWSYNLNDPSSFIITFFASNLIILISIAILIGFIYQIIIKFKKSKKCNIP
jgi:hypothetical protein